MKKKSNFIRLTILIILLLTGHLAKAVRFFKYDLYHFDKRSGIIITSIYTLYAPRKNVFVIGVGTQKGEYKIYLVKDGGIESKAQIVILCTELVSGRIKATPCFTYSYPLSYSVFLREAYGILRNIGYYSNFIGELYKKEEPSLRTLKLKKLIDRQYGREYLLPQVYSALMGFITLNFKICEKIGIKVFDELITQSKHSLNLLYEFFKHKKIQDLTPMDFYIILRMLRRYIED